MRARAGVGIAEDDLSAGFEAAEDGLGERVGRIDGDVDSFVLGGVFVLVEDGADFGQSRDGVARG